MQRDGQACVVHPPPRREQHAPGPLTRWSSSPPSLAYSWRLLGLQSDKRGPGLIKLSLRAIELGQEPQREH